MGNRSAKRAPIRLTRRGRVVLFTLMLGLAGGLASLIGQPGQASDPSGPPPTVVVHDGDTLWSIAGKHSPGRSRHATMADIRRLNGLDGSSLRVGQRLVLPRQR